MELTALSEIFGEYSIVVYELASILISGYLLQVIIRKLYISLYQRNTNDAESLVTGPLRFFFPSWKYLCLACGFLLGS
jgi:hypothetical protein